MAFYRFSQTVHTIQCNINLFFQCLNLFLTPLPHMQQLWLDFFHIFQQHIFFMGIINSLIWNVGGMFSMFVEASSRGWT